MTAVRSHLYVPGDRPDLFDKAIAGPAHALILDLEDGVAASSKAAARSHVAEVLARWAAEGALKPVVVRVDPAALDADLPVAVGRGAGGGSARGIVLAKATSATLADAAAGLTRLEAATGGPPLSITALIESARGLLDAADIAAHERVEGLAIGEADLGAELGLEPGPDLAELAPYRATIVVASAAAGLRRPTGPAGTDFRDLDRYRGACAQLRRQGFGGRSAVHPAQVEAINDCFAPSAAEIDRAREIVATFDAGVAAGRGVQVGGDGSMMDEAVVRSARRLLDGL